MLEFYLIKDDQAKPNSSKKMELKPVGKLDERTFTRLRNKGIIADRFDFYSDFRWGTPVIKQISQAIKQRQLYPDTDVTALLKLIQSANDHQCGLIAYAD